MFRQPAIATVLVLTLAVAACNGSRNNSSWSTKKESEPIVPPLSLEEQNANVARTAAATAAASSTGTTAAQGPSGRGVGPVDHVNVSSLDAARALEGSKLFPVKCSICHKIEERYIGPALTGVTKRRQPEWILNMILDPANMIQQDPTAKALLAQYIAPMANQHLTRGEAESILAFFVQHDSGLAGTQASPAETQAPRTRPAQPVSQQ